MANLAFRTTRRAGLAGSFSLPRFQHDEDSN